MWTLKGLRALVTGASGAIGSAIAKQLEACGAEVVVTGRNEQKLQELGVGLPFVCDLSDAKSAAELVPAVEKQVGPIDILVNNAGITKDNLLLRLTEEDWTSVMEVNVRVAATLAKACLRSMMKKKFGRIVNISSVVGFTGNPGQTNYAASKAALVGFSKSLAYEVATRGITVNCVAPGFIASAMTSVLTDEQKKTLVDSIPMKRIGEPEEIAYAVAYLASPQSAYMTGQTLHINGGMAMI